METKANFGCFFDVALEPQEIRGSFSYKSFFSHLGLSEKHIIFKIGDTFFPTSIMTPIFGLLCFKGYPHWKNGPFDLARDKGEELEANILGKRSPNWV